ncbi:MAG: amino acid decarboxylase [Gemmatimonadetes bacterium]|nr:amino acid decarboxylase [Gemmatimonadota bacterium]
MPGARAGRARSPAAARGHAGRRGAVPRHAGHAAGLRRAARSGPRAARPAHPGGGAAARGGDRGAGARGGRPGEPAGAPHALCLHPRRRALPRRARRLHRRGHRQVLRDLLHRRRAGADGKPGGALGRRPRGLPAAAAGHTASGGSIATLTAIAAARDAHHLKGRDYERTVVYLTSQTHHCVDKALGVAGLGEVLRREVPLDDGWRMRPDALAAQVAADRAAGLRPWLIIATAGSTDTGAVDPLAPIAGIAARGDAGTTWTLRTAGSSCSPRRAGAGWRGIERSDSVVLDPHKSLFLPWGSGMVLLRDREALLRSNAYTGSYMQDALREPGEISPADVSPELSRPFRALRMWLPLLLLGTRPFAAALEEKLLLARYFRREIGAAGFAVGPEPDLSVVTFRWAPDGMPLAEANAVNQRLMDTLRRDGRVFLSSTMLDGVFTLRLVALSFRTHRKAVDLAVRVLSEAVRGGV